MKKFKFLLLLAVAILATACPPVVVPPTINPGDNTEKGDGTLEKPYSVEEASKT